MTAGAGRRAALALVVALVLPLAACSGDDGDDAAGPPVEVSTTAPVPTASPTAAPTGTPSGPAPGEPSPTGGGPTEATVTSPPAGPSAPAGPADPGAPPPAGPEPSAAVTTLPPVAAGDDAALSDDVVVRVEQVRTELVTATAPGDVSGAAAVVRLSAHNEGGAAADLSGLAVTASVAGVPAPPLQVDATSSLGGVLAPGASAEGTYVFGLGDGDAEDVVVEISSGTSSTVVRVEA